MDHWFHGFEEVQDPEDEHKMAIQRNIRQCLVDVITYLLRGTSIRLNSDDFKAIKEKIFKDVRKYKQRVRNFLENAPKTVVANCTLFINEPRVISGGRIKWTHGKIEPYVDEVILRNCLKVTNRMMDLHPHAQAWKAYLIKQFQNDPTLPPIRERMLEAANTAFRALQDEENMAMRLGGVGASDDDEYEGSF